MGNRLSKIVTRTGDTGSTGLGDGTRVSKDHLRVETMGDVDELNSSLGVLLSEALSPDIENALLGIQHDLFDLGGELCLPNTQMISAAHIDRLEQLVETLNADLSPLKEFILPGGTRAASLAHLARAQCRRAERRLVQLGHTEHIAPHARQYLNRLSDLLFVLGRALNKSANRSDVLWQQGKNHAANTD